MYHPSGNEYRWAIWTLRAFVMVGIVAVIAAVASGCGSKGNGKDSGTSHVANTPLTSEASNNANTRFAFRFLKAADSGHTGNVVVSPLSLSMVLEMLANGADTSNGTQTALLKALGFPKDVTVDQVNADAHRLMATLTKHDSGVAFEIANGIWTAPKFTPSSRVASAVKRDFGGELARLDADATAAANQINTWARDHTRGRITKIVNPEEIYPPDTERVMLLGNALAFTGHWTLPFEKVRTKKTPFFAHDRILRLPMMSNADAFDYLETRGDAGFHAVRLTYGKSQRWSMYVFVPNARDGLDDMAQTFDEATWTKWRAGFTPAEHVEIGLPRLDLRFQRDLLGDLGRLQVPTRTFNSLVTQTTNPIYLDFARQQTYMKVDESGTKAAAATVIGMSSVSATGYVNPPRVIADHPYLMILADSKTGEIAFIAAIRDPNQHVVGME